MRKIVAFITIFFTLVMSIPTTTYAAQMQTPSGISYTDIGKEMDAYVTKYQEGLVSFETIVFDEEDTLYEGYYGYSDIENKIPADDKTVYEWGSTSKLLVWVSIMQLKEQGKLNFDTDIREYLPDGFLTKLQYEDEKITILNLMNHNAGFQESIYENQLASEDELYDDLEEAVKKCECYQAYHVGEHTAYSNWGTALGAYIVERVSGMNYVDYVHENIFTPLGMEHTSIDMHMNDNAWVKNQREKLKCYERYADEQYNTDYGIYHSWVQLFPAGAAVGTVRDLAIFAKGFVADDCPFFVNNATRDEMLMATSYYGDSTIEKNCHGLWTSQFAVQTLGHSGNTGGCTANLQFNPQSGIGIVILSNEPGETMFCTGLCSLIFGDIMDNSIIKVHETDSAMDMSGLYLQTRTIVNGYASAMQYAGGFFIAAKTDDKDVYNMPLASGLQLIHLGDKMWLQKSENGMSVFCYQSLTSDGDIQLETLGSDMINRKGGIVGTLTYFGFVLLGIGCLICLLIKIAVQIVRKICRKKIERSFTKRQIILQQFIQGVSGIIFFCLISAIGVKGYGFAVGSCIIAIILGGISFINGILLIRNTITDKEIRKKTRINQYIWAMLCFIYCIVIIWFQLYDFIHI